MKIIGAAIGAAATVFFFTATSSLADRPETPSERQKELSELREIQEKSIAVYRDFIGKGEQKIPPSVLDRAKCVAVFPETVSAAVVVGGVSGSGVVSCRTSNGRWSSPAFVDLMGGSLGLQAGVKSSDLVLFFVTEEARKALQQEKMVFGGDASVVAGTFDRSFDIGQSGVVGYQRAKGAFAGVSIAGGSIVSDDDAARVYYGNKAQYASLLRGEVPGSDKLAEEFSSILPTAK